MSRSRYEPIPQRDQESIILDQIHAAPPYNYNYNSGIPNSLPSSHAPSITSNTPSILSIPASPPPSFHTHSSPGTPRPTPSTRTIQSQSGYGAELWGVASSTGVGTEIGTGYGNADGIVGGTSNDALATIAGLKQRIEWLEESIGKLLIEKDSHICSPLDPSSLPSRDNCCVTFTDLSPDLERALTQGKGNNCCVSFRSSEGKGINKHTKLILGFVILFSICVMVTVILSAANGGNRNKRVGEGGWDGK